jgi:hypothetical protein
MVNVGGPLLLGYLGALGTVLAPSRMVGAPTLASTSTRPARSGAEATSPNSSALVT